MALVGDPAVHKQPAVFADEDVKYGSLSRAIYNMCDPGLLRYAVHSALLCYVDEY